MSDQVKSLRFGAWLLPALLLAGAGGFRSFAQSATNNAPGRSDYSSFKVISERNIFNPRRYPHSSRSQRREVRPSSRPDYFTLVGTMSYEKGPFAFFEGSSSSYRKVLKPHETIAGFTVTNIGSAGVELVSGTNEYALRVGMQMRHDRESGWQAMAAPEAPPASPTVSRSSQTRSSSSSAFAQAGTPPAPPNGEPAGVGLDPGNHLLVGEPPPEGEDTNAVPDTGSSETDNPILRRLMERREQEMNR